MASIYDSMFAEMDFRYSDASAREAVMRAVARSKDLCMSQSKFERTVDVEAWVRAEALADLVDGDAKSATRRRAVHGFGGRTVPAGKWGLHIDRVLWADCRISPKSGFQPKEGK